MDKDNGKDNSNDERSVKWLDFSVKCAHLALSKGIQTGVNNVTESTWIELWIRECAKLWGLIKNKPDCVQRIAFMHSWLYHFEPPTSKTESDTTSSTGEWNEKMIDANAAANILKQIKTAWFAEQRKQQHKVDLLMDLGKDNDDDEKAEQLDEKLHVASYDPLAEADEFKRVMGAENVEVFEHSGYDCPKCGSKTRTFGVQLRRADEGATYVIKCRKESCAFFWTE